jgi:hypothetical protein
MTKEGRRMTKKREFFDSLRMTKRRSEILRYRSEERKKKFRIEKLEAVQ